MTHPVQYFSPWFRHIHDHEPGIDLHVVYATDPTSAQQGVGFNHAFKWDIPLRDGYQSIVLRPHLRDASVDSDVWRGVDVPEITDVVNGLEPDVALIPGWHSITQLRAIVGLRRGGIPLLYRGDSTLDMMSRRWPRLSRARARFMLRQFSGYLAVGTKSREYLRAMGVDDPAIVSSPHAVDNDAFRLRATAARPRRSQLRAAYGFSDEHQVVLCAGKLIPRKRPQDVIDAAALLPRGAVLFVGDGSERAALEARARERNVRVVFAGFLNQQQIPNAYVAADALMVAGRETWGLVANEALASGLPVVISTSAAAAADLAAPEVCVAVQPGNVAAYAAALSALTNRPRDEVVGECENVISRFSYAAATEGLLTAARFAVTNSRRPAGKTSARIAALCGNFVIPGGMERITFEALGALQRGGGDVHALLNSWSSRPIAALAERHAITWEVGYYDAPLDGVFRNPLRMTRACGDVMRSSLHLAQLMWTRRITHVFAADFRAVLAHAPALLLCKLLGVAVVLRSGVAPTPSHAPLWRWFINPLVTRHIANSTFTARELHAIGIPTTATAVIPNIAPDRHLPAKTVDRQPNRICYAGQIIPEKGVMQLIDAVRLLIGRGLDVHLDIVGQMDGWAPAHVLAYRTAIRAHAESGGVEGRVSLLGWREDVDTVMKGASVHCCPSQPDCREAFGITVVEAKRAGIPSVVCPSGALAELVSHQVDGWIASGFDAESIADGLEWLLQDRRRLEEAQRAALESARRFDPAAFERHWQYEFGLRDRNTSSQAGIAVVGAAGIR